MPDYDAVADRYDDHFRRPVDRWEDERLAGLLTPLANGRRVLDLGCGTGWVLDHLLPDTYVGLDASAAMLDRLLVKHPGTTVVKADLDDPGWVSSVPDGPFDVVVSTWAAHEFPLYQTLMGAILLMDTRARWTFALHGQAPRYAERHHYILDGLDERKGYLTWTTDGCKTATPDGLRLRWAAGTGAVDDAPDRREWERASRKRRPDEHFAFLAVWGVA